MEWLKGSLSVRTRGPGLYDFTDGVRAKLEEWKVGEGLCHLFLRHTSASLAISENYDPSARADLEEFLRRLAPEGLPWYRHTAEGPDDSPSHMRAVLTGCSQSVPVDGGRLSLGTWQGLFLCEHRRAPQTREILVRCLKAG